MEILGIFAGFIGNQKIPKMWTIFKDRACGDMTSEVAARSQRMRLGCGASCMEELQVKVQRLLEERAVLQQEALSKLNQGQ